MWKETTKGIEIAVKVTPKAHRNEILGWENSELKVRIAAVPEKGDANKELIRFLAKELGIGKSQIIILSGETSRHKRLLFCNINIKQPKNNIWEKVFPRCYNLKLNRFSSVSFSDNHKA